MFGIFQCQIQIVKIKIQENSLILLNYALNMSNTLLNIFLQPQRLSWSIHFPIKTGILQYYWKHNYVISITLHKSKSLNFSNECQPYYRDVPRFWIVGATTDRRFRINVCFKLMRNEIVTDSGGYFYLSRDVLSE